MRTMLLVLGIIAIASLSGCVTGSITAVVPEENSSFSYWNGSYYVWVDPDDYYYRSYGVIYHHHHSVDVVIDYTPPVTVYVHPQRIDISDYNHSRMQTNHPQQGYHRQPMMKPPRGGYGQPAIPNPNHRTDTRQRVPQEMKPPVNRQVQPPNIDRQTRPVNPPQVRQQRRAPQQITPPVVRQVPRQSSPTRVAPQSRSMPQSRIKAPQRVMQKPVSRPSRPLHSIPQGNRGTRKR